MHKRREATIWPPRNRASRGRIAAPNHGSVCARCTAAVAAPTHDHPALDHRSTEPKVRGSNPLGRATCLGRSCAFAGSFSGPSQARTRRSEARERFWAIFWRTFWRTPGPTPRRRTRVADGGRSRLQRHVPDAQLSGRGGRALHGARRGVSLGVRRPEGSHAARRPRYKFAGVPQGHHGGLSWASGSVPAVAYAQPQRTPAIGASCTASAVAKTSTSGARASGATDSSSAATARASRSSNATSAGCTGSRSCSLARPATGCAPTPGTSSR